eukprot:2678278-Prymnesium_polylepis.1
MLSEAQSQYNERSRSAPPRVLEGGWTPSRSFQPPAESVSRAADISEARQCRWPESRGDERRSWLHRDRRGPAYDPNRPLLEQRAAFNGTPSGLRSRVIDRRRQASRDGLRFERAGGALFRAAPRDDSPGEAAAGEESSSVSAKQLTLRFERDGLAGLTSNFDTWFRPSPGVARVPSWGFDPQRHSLGGAGPAMYGAESSAAIDLSGPEGAPLDGE